MSKEKDYLEIYDEFWKEIIENEDGTINLDQLKKELSDYHFIMGEVSKVYCEVTDDMISKPNTYAFEVINLFERKFVRPSSLFYGEDLEEIVDDDKEFTKYIFESFRDLVNADDREDCYDKQIIFEKIDQLLKNIS